MLTWFALALGAAIGAPTRFAVDRFFVRRKGTDFPFGTLTVNLVGSFILGLLTGVTVSLAIGESNDWKLVVALIGTGFCGSLTTFSGWTSQIFDLSRLPVRWTGTFYGLGSVICGFALASIGYALGSLLG